MPRLTIKTGKELSVRAACLKIRTGFIREALREHEATPCAMLYCAVVERAVADLILSDLHRDSAACYISNNLYHAQVCGVDPDWVRLVLTRLGLDFTQVRARTEIAV